MKTKSALPTNLELARYLPTAFAKMMRAKFVSAPHLKPIDTALTQVVYGDLKRLIITMPRRHGKTFLTSETFPLWFIAVNEMRGRTVEVALVSYNQTKATDISRSLRDLFNHPDFNKIFPGTRLKDGNESVEQWSTEAGSKVYAVGVGGSLTGRGANLIVVDDSYKNAEEALSAGHRKKVNDWYETAAFTSLYEDGVVIHIGTRWHSEDLIGTVLKKDTEAAPEYKENWHVIHQQAIIDEGTDDERPLWPRDARHRVGFTMEFLKRMRQNQGYRWWSTQYRGIPIDEAEGVLGFPKRGTPSIYPKNLFCFVDTAFDGQDLTAFVIGGIIPGTEPKQVWVAYADARRANSVALAPVIAGKCKEYGVRSCIIEKNADKGWTADAVRSHGIHTISKNQNKNKVGRIQTWVGNIYSRILVSEHCTPEFVAALSGWSELSTHDDCPDALAGLTEHLLGSNQGATVLPPNFFRG